MEALAMAHSDDVDSRETVRIWIENDGGSIARGVVEVLSEAGAVIRVSDLETLDTGSEVAVRLGCDARSPTLGLAARVLWILSNDESSECELEWLPCPDRARLGPLIASLG
jgi:PilZ domain